MYCRMDEDLEREGKKMSRATRMPPEEEPKLKVFAPVNPNLEMLENSEGDLDGRRP